MLREGLNCIDCIAFPPSLNQHSAIHCPDLRGVINKGNVRIAISQREITVLIIASVAQDEGDYRSNWFYHCVLYCSDYQIEMKQ